MNHDDHEAAERTLLGALAMRSSPVRPRELFDDAKRATQLTDAQLNHALWRLASSRRIRFTPTWDVLPGANAHESARPQRSAGGRERKGRTASR